MILVEGDEQMSGSGDTQDWRAVNRLRRAIDGDFLWVRIGGQRYLIEDAEALEELKAVFEPQRELGEQQSRLGDQQSSLGDRQSELVQRSARERTHDAVLVHVLSPEWLAARNRWFLVVVIPSQAGWNGAGWALAAGSGARSPKMKRGRQT